MARVLALYPGLSITEDSPLYDFFASAEPVRVPAGTVVFRKGDACENYLMVLRGVVRVQVSSDSGREVTLYRVRPGGSCAITTSCLISSQHYPAEAVTELDVVAIAMPREQFRAALADSEQFREFVFDGFAMRLASIIERVDSVVLKSVDDRLIEELLRMDVNALSNLTHQQIAADIGTAREVVSRKLKALETRGLIQVNRGKISIKDRKGLTGLLSHPS